MGDVKWYGRDPNAALVGMRILSCEERGAYNTVLDLIYAHDGRIADKDRYLAGECALSVQAWRRIRNHLIELGKLYLDTGYLRNNRADIEVEKVHARVESARSAGRASGRSRNTKNNKNNDIDRTVVRTDVEPTTTTPTSTKSLLSDSDSSSEESSNNVPAPTTRVLNEFDFVSSDGTIYISAEEFRALEAACPLVTNLRNVARAACRAPEGWLLAIEPEQRKAVLIKWLHKRQRERAAAPPRARTTRSTKPAEFDPYFGRAPKPPDPEEEARIKRSEAALAVRRRLDEQHRLRMQQAPHDT